MKRSARSGQSPSIRRMAPLSATGTTPIAFSRARDILELGAQGIVAQRRRLVHRGQIVSQLGGHRRSRRCSCSSAGASAGVRRWTPESVTRRGHANVRLSRGGDELRIDGSKAQAGRNQGAQEVEGQHGLAYAPSSRRTVLTADGVVTIAQRIGRRGADPVDELGQPRP